MLSRSLLLLFLLTSAVSGEVFYSELKDADSKTYSISKEELKEVAMAPVTPLGSLWKLFVFSYLKATIGPAGAYTCNGHTTGENFCCKKGESITVDTALIRSCGLYFERSVTSIIRQDWRKFWTSHGLTFPWLLEFRSLGPKRVVSVAEILQTIKVIKGFPAVEKTLRNVIVNGTAVQGLSALGSYPRLKTFTWDDPNDSFQLIGGAAGWLPDGRVFWFYGKGKSHQVIETVSHVMEKHWDFSKVRETECVEVRFFRDYPIQKVMKDGREVGPGVLKGEHVVHFENGNIFKFIDNGSLTLGSWNKAPIITGKLNLTDYIARVIDREFNAGEKASAEALSIVARTYFYQNARKTSECFEVPDSSAFQRVSASAPSAKALAIAGKTADLILDYKNIHYHKSVSSPGTISWEGALTLQNKGRSFNEILKVFYPDSRLLLKTSKSISECKLLRKAHAWLKRNEKKWRRDLVGHAGFEFPQGAKVCHSSLGTAYANLNHNEIYVEDFSENEDLISIAHEWIHLAFKNYPIRDEKRIDQLAKTLIVKGSL